MRLAVYTYGSEPFVWYPSPRVSFITFSKKESNASHSVWETKSSAEDLASSPMALLPRFDAWLWVDSRVSELTIDFGEFVQQIDFLDKNFIYGIGKSNNGFRTISTGCLAEPDTERSEKLLKFIYGTTLMPGARKYSLETPLQTFSAILFLRSSSNVENACLDAARIVHDFPGLNPQVALNWAAWKNTVKIEEIEDLHIQHVRHKIWSSFPPVISRSENNEAPSALQAAPVNKLKPIWHDENKQQLTTTAAVIDDPLEPNMSPEVVARRNILALSMGQLKENFVETLGNHPAIDHELLAKLAADSRSSFSEFLSLPNVSVMMTTWNRTPLAVKCLKSLVENIEYPLQKLYWVLADDGSEPGHVEACIDALLASGIPGDRVFTTRNYRSGPDAKFGHALNLNNGLREAFKHSDIVLRTEDDLLPSRKIPVVKFAKLLADNKNVAGIKLGHAGDVSRKLPWPGDPVGFTEDASYWNMFIFNHLAMICHKRVYDALGMYDESLSGAEVERNMGKRFMELFRKRTSEQEYSMKVLSPAMEEEKEQNVQADEKKKKKPGSIKWFYFTHIGKDSVSGHVYKAKWSDDVVELNSKELAEDIRAKAAKI